MNKIILFSIVFLVLMCLAGIVEAQQRIRRRLTPAERRQRRQERQERKARRKLAKLKRKEAREARRAERLRFLDRAAAEEESQQGLRAKVNDDLRVQAIDQHQEQVDFQDENYHKERSNVEFSFKQASDVDKGQKTRFSSKTASRSGFEVEQDKDAALEEFDRNASKKAHETELDSETQEESRRESLLDAEQEEESLNHQQAANRF